MRVLITGATGFVGQRMVQFLAGLMAPHEIVCLVHRPVGQRQAAALAMLQNLGVTIVTGDLERADVSSDPPPPFELLIHAAANTSTSVPESALRANDIGTQHLLDWVRPVSRGTRIIYISTIGVIDRSGPCDGPLTEESPCTPRTPYAVTKLRGEHVVRRAAERDGFAWTILRLPTVYGPGQMAGGLFDRLIQLSSSGSLLGRIDWPGRTSVIYVDDVARIAWSLGHDPRAANQLFCVASDESLTVAELAHAVGRAVGAPIRPIRLPRVAWSMVRGIAWNRLLLAAMPKMPTSVWLPFWRLGLIADDGFWFDTSRLRRVYGERLLSVDEGLRQMSIAADR